MNEYLPVSEISRLFTMTFIVNRALELSEVSEALSRRCPAAINGE